jgi:cell division septum initiation protein DivIVA
MDSSLTQTTTSHDGKIEDIRAELAKFSHDTNHQLAQLCQSVSAIQAKLLNTLATADNMPAASQVQHRHQRARVSDYQIPILASVSSTSSRASTAVISCCKLAR